MWAKIVKIIYFIRRKKIKLTQFYIKSEIKNNEVVFYNTLNEAVLILDAAAVQQFEDNIDSLNLKEFSEIKNVLIENEFLLDDDIDEEVNYMKALLNQHKKFNYLSVHILPTTACNFNCVYCYQSGIDRHQFLSQDKINDIISYLENHIKKHPEIHSATYILHGGEPTVNWKVVPNILQRLDEMSQLYKIKYRTQIVTNGYLLTPEKSELLSKYNWQRLQVTIDGPKDIHNSRRLMGSGKDSYSSIINNLKYIQDNKLIDKISIRLNFDQSNFGDIVEYLPTLKNIFGTKGIILSLGYISDTYGNTEAENYISENILKDEKMIAAYCSLYKKALELGFEMPDLFMLEGMCTAKLDNAFVIYPNGDVYKCLSGVGRKEFIESTIYKKGELDNYLYPELYKECFNKKCCFIPLCNSGCRFNGYLKTGRKNSNDCQKELLDNLNKKLLTIKYLIKGV